MSKRINIVLPDQVLAVLDSMARRGDRSRFISEAVVHYVKARGRAGLKQRLKEGALKRAGRDLKMATEWFALDEEPWRQAVGFYPISGGLG